MKNFPSDEVLLSVWDELNATSVAQHPSGTPFVLDECDHCEFFTRALTNDALARCLAIVAVKGFGMDNSARYSGAITQLGTMLFYLGYKVREREMAAESLENRSAHDRICPEIGLR